MHVQECVERARKWYQERSLAGVPVAIRHSWKHLPTQTSPNRRYPWTDASWFPGTCSSLVRPIYSRLDAIFNSKSSDISGIPVIKEIITMNQNVNINVWYAFHMCQEGILFYYIKRTWFVKFLESCQSFCSISFA